MPVRSLTGRYIHPGRIMFYQSFVPDGTMELGYRLFYQYFVPDGTLELGYRLCYQYFVPDGTLELGYRLFSRQGYKTISLPD